jgi:hypothetical protein
MATDLREGSEPSLSGLATGILNDVQNLFKQQVAMLREEIKDDFQKAVRAASVIAAGVAMSLLGGIFLCLTLVYFLAWAFPALSLWGCFAIVGGSLAFVGVSLFYLGKNKLSSFSPLPDQSVEALKENMRWIRNPK